MDIWKHSENQTCLACWPDIRTLSGALAFYPHVSSWLANPFPSEQCYQRLLHKPCLAQTFWAKNKTTRQTIACSNCFGQKLLLSIRCVTREGGRDSHGAPCQTKSRKGKDPTAGHTAVIAGPLKLDSTAAPSYMWWCFLILNMIKLQKKNMENTLPSEPIDAISIFIHVYAQVLSPLSLSSSLSFSKYK